jgi:adenylate cyclase
MPPEGVMAMLNTCLPVMIEAVVESGGIVNKFAGDNIMAVWNAPSPHTDHARRAVEAAWNAQKRVAELGKSMPGLAAVQFGVGINTGSVLAGNLGSQGRSEYTVIGDTVNLASRFCGSAPGGEIWVGPDTYDQISAHFLADALAPQIFKGKAKPIPVYRITGPIEADQNGCNQDGDAKGRPCAPT